MQEVIFEDRRASRIDKFPCYSRAEVLQHNKKDDCWVIVRNEVFDITPFLEKHPGGASILMSRAGEDATTYFLTKHGNNRHVFQQLQRLKVGEIIETERIVSDDLDEAFFMELVERCHKEKLYDLPSLVKNGMFWLRLVNITAFLSLSLAALYGSLPWWVCVLMVMAQGVIGTSLFGLVAHEATHRPFPSNKVLKVLLNVFWPVFWPFIPQSPLRYEHNSHHVKIGDPEYDFEVAGFAPLIRYSGLVEAKPAHRHQSTLAKFLYPFYAKIITTFGGAKSNFWSTHNRKVGWEHAFFIILTMTYYIVIPSLIGGSILWYLLLYLVYQSVLSFGIYIGSAINHFVPGVLEDVPDQKKDQYAYYCCHNTTNFCVDSKFWFWYTGGFNIQIEHHLNPFVPVENLRRMIPMVKELCDKYDYPYHHFNSVRSLWNAHYAYLRMMSGKEGDEAIRAEVKIRKDYHAR